MRIQKTTIYAFILFIAICYIISPWVFEKHFFFNEILALIGFILLSYHGFKIGKDTISYCIVFLLILNILHGISSLFRMDNIYYFLRNLVIFYSIFSFFTGYFCYPYLHSFIIRTRNLLRLYVVVLLPLSVSRLFFERFGMATLFPGLIKKAGKNSLLLLILLNLLYGITYDSATAFLIAAAYSFLLLVPNYTAFRTILTIGFILFFIGFVYLQPNLDIIAKHYNPNNDKAIHEVMNSNPILAIDGNSTWRLVLWKQVLVDQFPQNLLGLGFGTPMIKYYPVEDYSKLASLPYIIGTHNSFIYLFGRLGIFYLLLTYILYSTIFREYFHHKSFYYANNKILLFWTFIAISVVALFNPTLESPIFASGYWMVLGFLGRAIHNRKFYSIETKTT